MATRVQELDAVARTRVGKKKGAGRVAFFFCFFFFSNRRRGWWLPCRSAATGWCARTGPCSSPWRRTAAGTGRRCPCRTGPWAPSGISSGPNGRASGGRRPACQSSGWWRPEAASIWPTCVRRQRQQRPSTSIHPKADLQYNWVAHQKEKNQVPCTFPISS